MPGLFGGSLPNSSASSSGSLIALQLIRTNDAARRGDISWIRSANRSLPTPVSPTTSTLSRPSEIRDADCSSAASRLDLVVVSRREPARVCTISVTAPTRNGTPTVEPDRPVRRQLRAVDERAVRAADVLDLDVGADRQVGVVARHRAGVDHDVALARAADGERPAPGQRHDLERGAVDHEQHAVAERRLAIDLLGRRARFVVDHLASVRGATAV